MINKGVFIAAAGLVLLAAIFLNPAFLYSQAVDSINNSGLKNFEFKYSGLKESNGLFSKKPFTGKRPYSYEKTGDFLSFSTGIVFSENKSPAYVSADLNINLGFIADFIYLDAGVYKFIVDESSFGAQLTPGVGLDIFNKKMFAFAGAGYFIIFPYTGYTVDFRASYNVSKSFSAGVDFRLISFGFSGAYDINLIQSGINLSYRFNY